MKDGNQEKETSSSPKLNPPRKKMMTLISLPASATKLLPPQAGADSASREENDR
jgi:hypothetical protein